MPHSKPEVSRTLVGVFAATCLLASAVLFFAAPEGEKSALWQASFLRVGLVLGAFWLALPTKTRSAAWAGISWFTFLGIILAAFAAARFRYAVIPILIAIGTVGAFLRPRDKQRPSTRVVR